MIRAVVGCAVVLLRHFHFVRWGVLLSVKYTHSRAGSIEV